MDHTSGGVEEWLTTGRMDIAPSVLEERYKYKIHLACSIVGGVLRIKVNMMVQRFIVCFTE